MKTRQRERHIGVTIGLVAAAAVLEGPAGCGARSASHDQRFLYGDATDLPDPWARASR